ncbi:MAG: hypothetical protein ABIQ60_11040 [Burkholderiaceae bacterium]
MTAFPIRGFSGLGDGAVQATLTCVRFFTLPRRIAARTSKSTLKVG